MIKLGDQNLELYIKSSTTNIIQFEPTLVLYKGGGAAASEEERTLLGSCEIDLFMCHYLLLVLVFHCVLYG